METYQALLDSVTSALVSTRALKSCKMKEHLRLAYLLTLFKKLTKIGVPAGRRRERRRAEY
jgi:hypothetical protein